MEVGDRVKIVRSIYLAEELQAGATGVIVGVDDSIIDVRIDDDTEDFWPFEVSELEVI